MLFAPEGKNARTPENLLALSSPAQLYEAMLLGRILEAPAIVCDSAHNLIVDLGCMQGLIPREEGAIGIKEGKVRDIAIITRVGRDVCFVIRDFAKDALGNTYAILSRKEAQLRCRREYLDGLIPGDIIDARITHLEPFGAFADIGCGIVSLLPIDLISVSRIEHPSQRFAVDMYIRAIIKSTDNGRITLSHRELLGTWEENAALFQAGETVSGMIRSVEPYGIFVELTPNLAGLAERREGAKTGEAASVYIKSILPVRMKIKLVIIDTFPEKVTPPSVPAYFFSGTHMDSFRYSPPACEKDSTVYF